MNVAPLPNTGQPGQIDNNYVGVPVTSNRTDQFDIRVDHSLSSAVQPFWQVLVLRYQPVPAGAATGLCRGLFQRHVWLRALAFAGSGCRCDLDSDAGGCIGNALWLLARPLSAIAPQLRGRMSRPVDRTQGTFRIPRPLRRPAADGPAGRESAAPQPDHVGSATANTAGPIICASRSPGSIATTASNSEESTSACRPPTWTSATCSATSVLAADSPARTDSIKAALRICFWACPTSYSQDSKTTFNIYQYVASAFLQDDWKVTPKLTLNLGLRYEFSPPPREANNQWANFDPATQKFVDAKSGSLFDQALIHPDWTNFAPRLGFAYSLFPRTVLRGGYGIFYNHTNRNGREGIIGFNPPFIVQAGVTAPGGTCCTPPMRRSGFRTAFRPALSTSLRSTWSNLSYKAQDMNLKNPYVEQWNFGIQQELITDLVLDVAYVGNYGRRLPAFRNLNPFAYSFAANGAPVVTTRDSGRRRVQQRHSICGRHRHFELPLVASTTGEAVFVGHYRPALLYLGQGAYRFGGPPFDQRHR